MSLNKQTLEWPKTYGRLLTLLGPWSWAGVSVIKASARALFPTPPQIYDGGGHTLHLNFHKVVLI